MIYKHRNKHIFTVKSAIWLSITTVGSNQVYANKKISILSVKAGIKFLACTLPQLIRPTVMKLILHTLLILLHPSIVIQLPLVEEI